MRKPYQEFIGIMTADEYLQQFVQYINDLKNHPYVLSNDKTEYEQFRSFKDLWNKMTSWFWSFAPLFDGKSYGYYKIGTDDLPSELVGCNWLDMCCPSIAQSIYSEANHDINAVLLDMFRFNRETNTYTYYLDFDKFWNETLNPLCDIFMDWANDTEHVIEFKQNTFNGLKPVDKQDPDRAKYRTIQLYNIPGTKYWKRCYYITNEETRKKQEARLSKIVKDIETKLETTQCVSYYTEQLSRYKNHLAAVQGKISSNESCYYILNIIR